MDKKDEIILQQLEVIRTMTERNLRSMGDDFWGTPFEGVLSPKSLRPRPPAGSLWAAPTAKCPPSRPMARPPAVSLPPRLRKRRWWSPCPRRT